MRTWLSFAAAVSGGVLIGGGILGFHPAWIFVAAGALCGLAGLLGIGERGGVSLLLAAAWLLVSAFVGWAAVWNAFAGGILAVATGFLATAGATPEAAVPASE
ncbi:MAG: hypothetical protein ABEJ46_01520 [Gemmatimonadota bacterium]